LLELGQRTLHASMSMNAGWIALLAGEPERAEAELREGVQVLEAGGERGTMSTASAVLAEVLYQLGRYDEAEEWTRRSERAASPEDVLSQALWRSTRAKVLARRGDAEHALRLSAEAVDWVRRSDGLPPLGDCLVGRAEVLRQLGHPDDARVVLEEALAVYERKGIVPSIERTQTLLAAIPA
jgi:ATP/maltotriose-dependent transcriptional regulator MalT